MFFTNSKESTGDCLDTVWEIPLIKARDFSCDVFLCSQLLRFDIRLDRF